MKRLMENGKRLFTAYAMCQSMFCALPSPFRAWEAQAEKQMLLFLPLIGLEIGAIWWAAGALCQFFGLPEYLFGIVMAALPYMLTGYMHLDGFMDVTDAVKSWRSLERRREILKDSHVGSFSVIACGLMLLAQFACFASWGEKTPLGLLLLIPVVSRSASALAVAALPPMQTSQYAGKKTTGASYAVPCVCVLWALLLGFFLWGRSALCLIGELCVFSLALRRAYRSLEGMNGDISGYCLTLSELGAVAVLVLLR